MTGATHRAGGMLVSIVGFAILRQKGLLLPGVNEAVQWLVMYPFTMWGSVASDLDHHWDSCPQKDIPSRAVNAVLHITKPFKKAFDKTGMSKNNPVYKLVDFFNASHRSWQTHSDLTLFAMLYLLYKVFTGSIGGLSQVDSAIITLVLTGICLGVVAHFILDSLTPEGIWLVVPMLINWLLSKVKLKIKLPQKLHFVPKAAFFATGGSWEQFVQKVLKICTVLVLVWFIWIQFAPVLVRYLPFEIQIY